MAPEGDQSKRPIKVGARLIGLGQPCFLVAEVGINHNGDVNLARKLIDAAADSGADAVKFQNYRTKDFILDRELKYEYVSRGKSVTESQFDMFMRYELSSDELSEISAHCKRRRVIFFSTPSGETGVDELVNLKVPIIKNGSDYLTNLPLIEKMGKTGLPVVISVGMASVGEIEEAIQTFEEAGGKDLIILHCVSLYPAPDEDANIRRIPTLARAFGRPVGFSDHTEGTAVAIGAVALGACMIEKHFTLDRELPGPDHRFSADPSHFKALVDSVRSLEKAFGSGTLGFPASEAKMREMTRTSCVAARALRAGHRLSKEDIVFSRPASGLPPKASRWLIGKSLPRDVQQGHVFTFDDFLSA